jgi:hypothetical protein
MSGAESGTPSPEYPDPFERNMFQKARQKVGGFAGAVADTIHDATGGWVGEKGRDAIGSFMNDFWNGSNKVRNRIGAIGGALALGGVIGYNNLNAKDVVAPYKYSSTDLSDSYEPPQAAISPIAQSGGGGASVRISAKGTGSRPSLAPAIEQGMQASGHSGNTNMTVNYQDNTTKMSRAWYRDKVEQHM